MTVREQTFETVPVESLTPHPDNPRRADTSVVVDSIAANGFYGALVVQRSTGHILAGNHRWRAAREAGIAELPVLYLDVDDDRARRILLVDNRTSDLAGYDDAELVALLLSMSATEEQLAGTGFTDDDLAAMISGDADEPAEDEVPPLSAGPAVTRPGDVWLLGPHRVVCGDCRHAATVARLLDGAQVNVAFTSPPYAQQRTYDESSGFRPIPPEEYVDWFRDVAANVREHLAEDGSWFVNVKPSAEGLDTSLHVFDLVLAHVREWGWHFATEYCWERNGVPKWVKRRFKNQFEPIYQFSVNDWKIRPDAVRHASENVPVAAGPGAGDTSWANAQGEGRGPAFQAHRRKRNTNGTRGNAAKLQGRGGRAGEYIGPGMAYPGNRLPTFTGSHDATGHTAAFPVGLPAFFIRAYSDPGDTVYDPFLGSGSTLLAAHHEQRIGYGCEISPGYVDVTCRRFQKATGIEPVLEATGETFDVTAKKTEGTDDGKTRTRQEANSATHPAR